MRLIEENVVRPIKTLMAMVMVIGIGLIGLLAFISMNLSKFNDENEIDVCAFKKFFKYHQGNAVWCMKIVEFDHGYYFYRLCR